MSGPMHTPEPWRADAAYGNHSLRLSNADDSMTIGRVIDSTPAGIVKGSMSYAPWAEGKANAARIVACVNACAGMDDPSAEIEALKADNATLMTVANAEASECEQLRSQRDALVASLTLVKAQI